MTNLIKEFKEFINRGNVVDLAVAVVLATAFTAVVTAFTDGILMQIVAALVGEPNFNGLTLDLGDTPIFYGSFLTALIRFLLVGLAVFMVVKALNEMQRRRARGETPADEEPPPPSDVELLAEIRDLLAAQNRPGI